MNSPSHAIFRSPDATGRRCPKVTFLVSIALLGVPLICCALPQPYCVFYGEARDEYGTPYLENAEVILRVEGRERSRWSILGMIAPGVNFKLPLEIDDGQGTPYAPYAVYPGQAVQISVRANGQERSIMETHVIQAGQPGDCLGILVTTGTDSDQDDLPDEWERLLIANSNGAFTNVVQVQPEDDFDGDGVSNLDEYRAGTYAFLSTDYLCFEEIARVTDSRLELRFLTTRGMSYVVFASDRLDANAEWQPVMFALTAEAAPTHQALVGDGYYVGLYLERPAPSRFFRLEAR